MITKWVNKFKGICRRNKQIQPENKVQEVDAVPENLETEFKL